VAATRSPVVFVGTGEHFDDIEPFAPRSFVSRLLGMGDMGQLVDTIKVLSPFLFYYLFLIVVAACFFFHFIILFCICCTVSW
jgi:hypothetical protein